MNCLRDIYKCLIMKKCVIEVGTWGGKYNSEILIDKEKINEFKKFIEKKNPFEDVDTKKY